MYGLNQGTRIGPYLLESQLGEGGQGSVWRAHKDGADGHPIALKIIPVRGAPVTMVERVRREAEALVRLSKNHPSVVSCEGLVEDEQHGVLAVAMEMVAGADLSEAVKDPRCDIRAREQILMHVARALGYLHAEGFVHRDVKPQNILVASRFYEQPNDPSTVKLVDFGIATPKGNPKPLTEVGTVIGTPAYMPPERIDPMFWQAQAGSMPTEDVFALGVVGYEAFFGRHPAGVEDDGTLSIYAEKYREVSRSQQPWPELPPEHVWSNALRGALALKRDQRLPDGNAVADAVLAGGNAPRASGSGTQMAMPVFEGVMPGVPAMAPMPSGGGSSTQVNPQMSAPDLGYAPSAVPAQTNWGTPSPTGTQAPGDYVPTPAPYAAPPNPLAMQPHGAPGGQSWAAPHAPAPSGGGRGGLIAALVVVIGIMTAGGIYLGTRGKGDDTPPPPSGTTTTATTDPGTATVAPMDSGTATAADTTTTPPGATTTAPPVYVPPHVTGTATHVTPPATTTTGTGTGTAIHIGPPPTATATTTTPPAVTTAPTSFPPPIHIGPPSGRPPGVTPTSFPPPPGGKTPIHIGH